MGSAFCLRLDYRTILRERDLHVGQDQRTEFGPLFTFLAKLLRVSATQSDLFVYCVLEALAY